jgi:signal peptidase II
MDKKTRSRYLPLCLTFVILLADQLSKNWIVHHIPENSIGYAFWGDFLYIVHVRNTAIAFSMGLGLPLGIRIIGFIVLPLVLLVGVAWVFFSKAYPLTGFQRWLLALFLGGGMGNLGDRIFRSFRVVDFISVNTYGFLGFERWPTWNIADASLVVSGILFALTLIFPCNGKKETPDV